MTPPPHGSPPLATSLFLAGEARISDLTDEDLALLLRQHQGPTYLVPLALERLAQDLWNDAGLYPGHLLLAVLGNRGHLGHAKELSTALQALQDTAVSRLAELDEVDRPLVGQELSRLGG